jgi:uncharacterized protein YbaP (TraB family)
MNYRIKATDTCLVGTMYLVPSLSPLPLGSVFPLIDAAEDVIFERDLEQRQQPTPHLLHSASSKQILSEELRHAVQALASTVGLYDPIDSLKPWYLAKLLVHRLQLQAGVMPAGIDRQLWGFAASKGKAIFFLEEQEKLNGFDAAPDSESVSFLKELVADPDIPRRRLTGIYHAWLHADQPAMDKAIGRLAAIAPTIHQNMFEKRNRAWMASILRSIRLKKRAVFAIGAAHLRHGEASLERLLKEHGFELEQLA